MIGVDRLIRGYGRAQQIADVELHPEKESQVASLVWQGLTNREIGNLMGTTEQVIKNHLRSTFDKLGVWSRLELAMYVASHGGKNWGQVDRVVQGIAQGVAS